MVNEVDSFAIRTNNGVVLCEGEDRAEAIDKAEAHGSNFPIKETHVYDFEFFLQSCHYGFLLFDGHFIRIVYLLHYVIDFHSRTSGDFSINEYINV